jgi:hypothetical protein
MGHVRQWGCCLMTPINVYLVVAAALSGVAAILHILIIIYGPSWYLFFGAGQQMADMAAAGKLYPALITTCVALVLLAWSAYALSGAGLVRPLPLLKIALCAITAIYLLRGLAVIPIQMLSRGGASVFWWWSSLICFGYGVVHLIGLIQVWRRI